MKIGKRLASGLLAVMLAGSAAGQTRAVVTIGGSVWNAKSQFEGDAYQGMKADAATWVGPYLNIRLGKVLLGTSMYFGKIPIKSTSDESDFSIDLNRSDLNFSLGYSLHPNLNAFFAVKNATIKGDREFPYTVLLGYDDFGDPYFGTYQAKIDMENKGTLLGGGLSSTYRFPQSPFFLFGSFALLKGTLNSVVETTIEGQSVGEPYNKDNSITLKAFNAGLGVQTASGISILVGFRGETSTGEGEGQEKVNGIMATLAYTLR